MWEILIIVNVVIAVCYCYVFELCPIVTTIDNFDCVSVASVFKSEKDLLAK